MIGKDRQRDGTMVKGMHDNDITAITVSPIDRHLVASGQFGKNP